MTATETLRPFLPQASRTELERAASERSGFRNPRADLARIDAIDLVDWAFLEWGRVARRFRKPCPRTGYGKANFLIERGYNGLENHSRS